MGFYFDVYVVVYDCDMVWLLVGCIYLNFVDSGSCVYCDAFDVGIWFCGRHVVHGVLGCDVIKVAAETSGDGGEDISGKVSCDV